MEALDVGDGDHLAVREALERLLAEILQRLALRELGQGGVALVAALDHMNPAAVRVALDGEEVGPSQTEMLSEQAHRRLPHR